MRSGVLQNSMCPSLLNWFGKNDLISLSMTNLDHRYLRISFQRASKVSGGEFTRRQPIRCCHFKCRQILFSISSILSSRPNLHLTCFNTCEKTCLNSFAASKRYTSVEHSARDGIQCRLMRSGFNSPERELRQHSEMPSLATVTELITRRCASCYQPVPILDNLAVNSHLRC